MDKMNSCPRPPEFQGRHSTKSWYHVPKLSQYQSEKEVQIQSAARKQLFLCLFLEFKFNGYFSFYVTRSFAYLGNEHTNTYNLLFIGTFRISRIWLAFITYYVLQRTILNRNKI
jgi:hypothetical protein